MNWADLELRWVLLGLGLVVVVGVYLLGVFATRSKAAEETRVEPDSQPGEPEAGVSLAESTDAQDGTPGMAEAGTASAEESTEIPGELHSVPGDPGEEAETESVITLRMIAREGGQLDADRTVQALREAGLQHGPYEIFHYTDENGRPESGFSVANLVEPGSFDLTRQAGSTLPGVTFFLVLPGSGDPVKRFDRMASIAHSLSQSLDAELFDELGSSWSIQRERFVREELIEYRYRQSQA